MGNAISFRLNPKNESDKRILDWLEEKSGQPGFFNLTEVIKKAILTAIEDEQKENQEKSIEDWISEAILLSREEFTKIVKESSQTVANNVFAGVLGAMAQQVNMGAVPMSQMTGMVPNSVPVNGSIHVTDVEALDNELAADTSAKMDNSTKSMLGTGVVSKCDGKYISIQFSTGPKAGQTVNYSLEMCLKNGLIELI